MAAKWPCAKVLCFDVKTCSVLLLMGIINNDVRPAMGDNRPRKKHFPGSSKV